MYGRNCSIMSPPLGARENIWNTAGASARPTPMTITAIAGPRPRRPRAAALLTGHPAGRHQTDAAGEHQPDAEDGRERRTGVRQRAGGCARRVGRRAWRRSERQTTCRWLGRRSVPRARRRRDERAFEVPLAGEVVERAADDEAGPVEDEAAGAVDRPGRSGRRAGRGAVGLRRPLVEVLVVPRRGERAEIVAQVAARVASKLRRGDLR